MSTAPVHPLVQALISDMKGTVGTLLTTGVDHLEHVEHVTDPHQVAHHLVGSGYTMGVETGLAIALADPDKGRVLLAEMDRELQQNDPKSTVDERQRYLALYGIGSLP